MPLYSSMSMSNNKDRRLKSQPERSSGSISGSLQQEANGPIADQRKKIIFTNSIESMKNLNNMSKSKFMKLSNDEIFQMIQNSVTEQAAMQPTKSMTKPTKPKKKPANKFVSKMREISKKDLTH